MQINLNPKITAGISERSDGSMVWWNALPIDEKIKENRGKYFKSNNIDPSSVVAGGIAHGINVTTINDSDAGRYIVDSDGLITNVKNLFLSVTSADCLPIYLYDPIKECIGLAHAGWKGLVGGIIENTIEKLKEVYGSNARDIEVYIGPHIKSCHYEIGKEIVNNFDKQNILTRDDKIFVDLSGEAKQRLERLGVNKIEIDNNCTYCNSDKFYSARFDKKEPLEGMVAYIGLK